MFDISLTGNKLEHQESQNVLTQKNNSPLRVKKYVLKRDNSQGHMLQSYVSKVPLNHNNMSNSKKFLKKFKSIPHNSAQPSLDYMSDKISNPIPYKTKAADVIIENMLRNSSNSKHNEKHKHSNSETVFSLPKNYFTRNSNISKREELAQMKHKVSNNFGLNNCFLSYNEKLDSCKKRILPSKHANSSFNI